MWFEAQFLRTAKQSERPASCFQLIYKRKTANLKWRIILLDENWTIGSECTLKWLPISDLKLRNKITRGYSGPKKIQLGNELCHYSSSPVCRFVSYTDLRILILFHGSLPVIYRGNAEKGKKATPDICYENMKREQYILEREVSTYPFFPWCLLRLRNLQLSQNL